MASTKDVVDHHLKCFGEGDLKGILSDYATGAILFTPERGTGHLARGNCLISLELIFNSSHTRFWTGRGAAAQARGNAWVIQAKIGKAT